MHRVLIIQLGGAVEPAIEALMAEARRIDAIPVDGASTREDLQVGLVVAPVEGVGNLSRPVEVLKERLYDDLESALVSLLRMRPGSTGEFVLDVMVLGNLGDPLVPDAARVVVSAVREIVDVHFGGVFPLHRTGSQRRFRILPFFTVPSPRESEEDRTEVLGEIRSLLDEWSRKREGSDRETPVDRMFLLDGVTTHGVSPLGDLVAQLHNMLRLILFTGLRRTPDFVTLLERPCSDKIATFGCAAAIIDRHQLHDRLSERLTRRVINGLAPGGDVIFPAVSEFLPTNSIADDESLSNSLTELREAPLRMLRIDGTDALPGLADLYDAVMKRLEQWREDAEIRRSEAAARAEETATEGGADAGQMTVLGSFATALGAGVFGAAHWLVGLAIAASIAFGFVFAAAAFVIFLFIAHLLRSRGAKGPAEPSSEVPNTTAEEDRRLARLKKLKSTAEAMKASLDRLQRTIDLLVGGFPPSSSDADSTLPTSGPFTMSLLTRDLEDHLFDRFNPYAGADEAAKAYLEERGSWEELLQTVVDLDEESVRSFGRDAFLPLLDADLFEEADARIAVTGPIKDFVDRWSAGIPLALACESGKQFDSDGFCTVWHDTYLLPPELGRTVEEAGSKAGVDIRLGDSTSRGDALFFVSATTDIAAEAVTHLHDAN